MSFSQKHSGKVLVPWYNVSEWQLVKELIYSEENRDWKTALEILKIWKLRTPLLSAGVNGALILLEALSTSNQNNNSAHLTAFERSQIFSMALMRFLNICTSAGSESRQGTFYQVARKNELPDWLISIRHEIAHSHLTPSEAILEFSLRFCLEWLYEKYWQVHRMTDFCAKNRDLRTYEDALHIYIALIRNLQHKTSDKALKNRIKRFSAIDAAEKTTPVAMLEKSGKLMEEAFGIDANWTGAKVCEILVHELIAQPGGEMSNDLTKLSIDSEFLLNWTKILDLLHTNHSVEVLVSKLFLKYVCDSGRADLERHIAALWMKEIYAGLLGEGVLKFSAKSCVKNQEIIDDVLNNPTIFNRLFLREFLTYSGVSEVFVEDSWSLLEAMNGGGSDDRKSSESLIKTVADLGVDFDDSSVSDSEMVRKSGGWKLVEEPMRFKNLPLGVLPNQMDDRNPLILSNVY